MGNYAWQCNYCEKPYHQGPCDTQPAGVSEGDEALVRAVRAYQSEFDNPCPDYNLRAQRRKEMFALAALHPEQAKDGAAG